MTADVLHPSESPLCECALRAVVLTPQRPIAETLMGRAVLLDLSALRPTKVELRALLARLAKRNIRIMAVGGIDPALLGRGIPPLLNAVASDAPSSALAPHAPVRVIEGAVRPGQSIVFPEGDLTMVGSVSSGLRWLLAARSTSTVRAARPSGRRLK